MVCVDHSIAGYAFGSSEIAKSPVSLAELEKLKITVGYSEEDKRYLKMAGAVLTQQTEHIVKHWRSGIIAGIPHLARHSRALDGTALPDYLSRSNRRFEQWILDTCFKPYDQAWLDYQHEIALRHTSARKNTTDGVTSTPFIPFHDIIGFVAVMNETIKVYLAADGHTVTEIEKMHMAWCKSLQLQVGLWNRPYMDAGKIPSEW